MRPPHGKAASNVVLIFRSLSDFWISEAKAKHSNASRSSGAPGNLKTSHFIRQMRRRTSWRTVVSWPNGEGEANNLNHS